MDWKIFILSLIGLQIFCLIAGWFLARGMKNNKDYFLASRSVSFFPLMMTLVATQVGGGLVLGAAQEAYTFGWSVLLYPLGQSLGFLLLAAGIGKKMAQSGASTIAELCERAFGSRKLRQVASILSMLSLFMIFVAQVIASKKFMISLGLPGTVPFIAFWGVVILYTVIGGLKGVIAIDLIQAIFFIAVFIVAVFASSAVLPESFLSMTLQENFADDPTPKLLGWLLMPLLFMAIEQDMGQRCFAADSPRTITMAALGATVVTFLVGTIPVFFGVFARTLDLPAEAGGSIFMSVIQATTNPTVVALIAVAILAVLMSTAISLINAISSNLTQDFQWEKTKGGTVRVARMMTAIIAVLGIFFSQFFDNIVDLLIQSYELSLSCLFVPVMVALLKKRGSAFAAWLSFYVGAFSFFLFRMIPYVAPKEIICLSLSALAYYIGTKWKKS